MSRMNVDRDKKFSEYRDRTFLKTNKKYESLCQLLVIGTLAE
jgi:hypothetical protein